MSDVLSQLNLVFGSSPKQAQSKFASLGDSPEDQVNGLFADDQAGRNQHEQAGGRPGSFAAALEQETVEESEAKAKDRRTSQQARLDSLGVFYAEERAGYSDLELGIPLQPSASVGKELPQVGEILPPHESSLVSLEGRQLDDNALLISAAHDELPTAAGELWNGLPGVGSEEGVLDQQADDVFADLAFLPGADPAGAVVAQVTEAAAETESMAASLLESGAHLSEDLQQQVQSKSFIREQAAEQPAAASKAAAFTLDQQEMRRSSSRDLALDSQRFGPHPGGDMGSLEENRPQQFDTQLTRTPTAVEKENLAASLGLVRETSSVPGQSTTSHSTASHATAGQVAATATRIEQQNSFIDQSPADGTERRVLDMRLGTTVGKPEWGEHLGRQLNLMIGRSMDQASIQLDPPELGPMQIRLQLQQDQVSVQISAHHAVVRDAVEQSVARLQQLFNEEGMELLQVTVSDEQGTGEGSDRREAQSGEGEREENLSSQNDGNLTPVRIADTSDGKIDYFV